MIGGAYFTAQADRLIGHGLKGQPLVLSPLERWENALQGLAESRVRTWSQVVRPPAGLYHHGRRTRLRRSASCNATRADKQAVQDILHGRLWFLLTALLFTLPVNLCLGLLLLSRALFFRALQGWLVAEGCFLVFRYFEHRRVSKMLIHNPIPTTEEVRVLLERILKLRGDVDSRTFLSGWFLGAPVEKIRRGNMREFLAYAFYHRSYDTLGPSYAAAVEGHICRAEEAWGFSFAEGHDPELQFMAHTREPLRCLHHPLALYVWARLVALFTGVVLSCMGFRRWQSAQPSLSYWYRPAMTSSGKQKAKEEEGEKMARVFVHGLGIGVTPYLGFISMLLQGHQGATVVVELGHVALQLQRRIPIVDDLVAAVEDIHKRHNLGPAQYIGHSYGSMLIARLVRKCPQLVGSLALVDPVCFLLCLPDVVYNFIYRTPTGRTPFMAACDWARWYFVSKEIQVAQVLCRGFDWHAVHLWTDQIPSSHTAVMLAGCDNIVPAPHVKRYLEKHGVSVVYNEEYQHAEYLFRPEAQRALLVALEKASVGAK